MSILIYKQRHRHPNQKKTPKCNYAHIGYIATRPGAVKNEGMRHGLFGKLEPGEVREFSTWQEAARLVRELSYRRVNMYRGIISFSPETAAELGLTDHKAWEDYMERHILTLAKYNGIRVQNLQWVAAHHNERGHPHIHVVFWDKNQRTMVPFVHPSIPDKMYGDNVFEKDGIRRDRTGDGEKTRCLCGKRGIFNRDGPAMGPQIIRQLE